MQLFQKNFKAKKLELNKSCMNVEKLRDFKRKKTNKPKKLTKKNSFNQKIIY